MLSFHCGRSETRCSEGGGVQGAGADRSGEDRSGADMAGVDRAPDGQSPGWTGMSQLKSDEVQ